MLMFFLRPSYRYCGILILKTYKADFSVYWCKPPFALHRSQGSAASWLGLGRHGFCGRLWALLGPTACKETPEK